MISKTVKNSQKTVKTAKMTTCWCANRHMSTKTVPTMYQQCTNREKQSKIVKRQSKQQKWPLVYQSSHVYQDCTNSVPIVKNSQKQANSKKWSLVYQSSHVYTESVEYTKPCHQCLKLFTSRTNCRFQLRRPTIKISANRKCKLNF